MQTGKQQHGAAVIGQPSLCKACEKLMVEHVSESNSSASLTAADNIGLHRGFDTFSSSFFSSALAFLAGDGFSAYTPSGHHMITISPAHSRHSPEQLG